MGGVIQPLWGHSLWSDKGKRWFYDAQPCPVYHLEAQKTLVYSRTLLQLFKLQGMSARQWEVTAGPLTGIHSSAYGSREWEKTKAGRAEARLPGSRLPDLSDHLVRWELRAPLCSQQTQVPTSLRSG